MIDLKLAIRSIRDEDGAADEAAEEGYNLQDAAEVVCDELERLRAILDKLPTCWRLRLADSKLVRDAVALPGEKNSVYAVVARRVRRGTVTWESGVAAYAVFKVTSGEGAYAMSHSHKLHLNECGDTPAAAEALRVQKGGD